MEIIQNLLAWFFKPELLTFSILFLVPDELHMLYTEITTRDKQKLFYNKHGGV